MILDDLCYATRPHASSLSLNLLVSCCCYCLCYKRSISATVNDLLRVIQQKNTHSGNIFVFLFFSILFLVFSFFLFFRSIPLKTNFKASCQIGQITGLQTFGTFGIFLSFQQIFHLPLPGNIGESNFHGFRSVNRKNMTASQIISNMTIIFYAVGN